MFQMYGVRLAKAQIQKRSLLSGCKKFQIADAQSREANKGQERKGLEGQDKVFRV